MLSPVKKIRLADMVFEQIKNYIVTHEALPGACLGSEREMCRALNVSRSVLRESLSSLKAQGFVRVESKGVFVESISPKAIKEPIEQVLNEDDSKIFELNEVRRILESGMAALAIQRATPEDIKKIKRSLTYLEKAYENQKLGDKENVEFHLSLAKSCHNSIYMHVLYALLNLLQKAAFIGRSRLLKNPENAEIIMEHHREIFKAFIAKDPDRVSKAIIDHLLWSDKGLRRLSQEEEKEK